MGYAGTTRQATIKGDLNHRPKRLVPEFQVLPFDHLLGPPLKFPSEQIVLDTTADSPFPSGLVVLCLTLKGACISTVPLAAALEAQQADPFSHFSESPARLERLRRVKDPAMQSAVRNFIDVIGVGFC